MKRLTVQLLLMLILSSSFIWIVGCASNLEASSQDKLATPPQEVKVHFKLPNRGAPSKRKAGAASRGDCPSPEKYPGTDIDKQLTALIPATGIGLTTASHPTFWFFVPYPATPPRDLVFVLEDEYEKKEIYKTKFEIEGTPGILSLKLPETVAPLEIDKKYRWIFSYLCNSKDSSQDAVVYGYVQRINLSSEIENQLETATTPIDKVAIYAENGVWYETLTGLAQLRLQEPQNEILMEEWLELLKSVGLDDMAAELLVSSFPSEE